MIFHNMLKSSQQCLSLARMFLASSRHIGNTSALSVKKINETSVNGTTIVEVVETENKQTTSPVSSNPALCSMCTCNIPISLKYSDILILEQFMRPDGTVLPRQLTGLCKKQQLKLERCVMQAHWAGLFPDKTISEFDRAGYKRFNRYWNNDMDMYRLNERKEHGTWFYIKRYPTKNQPIKRRSML